MDGKPHFNEPGEVKVLKSSSVGYSSCTAPVERFASKISLIMGIVQIIMGVISLGAQIPYMVLNRRPLDSYYTPYWLGDYDYASCGTGIWFGVVYIVAGALVVTAAKWKTLYWIVVSLSVSTVAAGVAVPQVGQAAVATSIPYRDNSIVYPFTITLMTVGTIGGISAVISAVAAIHGLRMDCMLWKTPSYTAIDRQPLLESGQLASTSSQTDVRESTGPAYDVNLSFGLGVAQINLGIASILLQIPLLFLVYLGYPYPYRIGSGIWCGAMYIVAGAFGMNARWRATTAWIIVHLVLCCVAALCTVTHTVFTLVGLTTYYYSAWDGVALCICLIAVGLAEGVVAIIGASLSCHGLSRSCRCKKEVTPTYCPIGQVMIMTPQGLQPFTIIPITGLNAVAGKPTVGEKMDDDGLVRGATQA